MRQVVLVAVLVLPQLVEVELQTIPQEQLKGQKNRCHLK
jgi:hypothetical protein